MSKRSPNSVADDKMTDTPREERLTLSRQLLRRLKVLMRKSNETNGGLTLGLSEVWINYEMYSLYDSGIDLDIENKMALRKMMRL